MEKIRRFIDKIVPLYAVIPLLGCFGFNCLVYYGSRIITSSMYHYDITLKIDEATPFWPWTVSVYYGCFAFWGLNYILIGRISREHCYRFCLADMCSRVVCGLFFILFPTTNIRPEIIGNSFWDNCMRYLYETDAADNLFPSIHCLVSWFCYVGIRKIDKIPKWYQLFSAFFAVCVFISTLTTKQHVIVDVISGVLLAEVMYYMTHHTNAWRYYAKIADRISSFVFRCEIGDRSE